MIEIQKILVPTDFSEYSQHAVKYAVALAQSFKAKLYVVHVWEQSIAATPTETFRPEIWVEAETAEKERLNQVTQGLRTEGIDAELSDLAHEGTCGTSGR
jgi:nucleotide-binding universal stress UspA family protein